MRTAGWRIIWKKTITVIDATFVTCITGALWAKWGERGIFCCQSILVGVGGWKSQNNGLVMHGSILLETMHPTPSPGTPPGICNIFFIGGLFPTAGHAERDNFPPPSSWSTTTYTFFATSFWSVQKQNDRFLQLLWMFCWVYREKDNGCHNLVKTWTINLKMKTKKKNSLKRASLIEHFIGRLDQISLSLYVSKALYSFSYKNYLKLSWRNFSNLAFQKIKSIRVRIICTFISNFKTYL